MSKANLFNREVRANKSPRNAYDMGYSTLFSSPCGLLQPAYVQEVKKGDKLKLGLSNITRTRPVSTSAFMTFDEKIDFWYVPYYLLWSPYDEWRIRQQYPHSSLALQQAGQQNLCPYTSYSSFVAFLNSMKVIATGSSTSIQGYDFYNLNSVLRYMDLLGYGVPTNVNWSNLSGYATVPSGNSEEPIIDGIKQLYTTLNSSGIPLNYFRLAAFQCIYMHHYRNEEYEQLDPSYYNMDSLFSDGKADNSTPGSAMENSSPSYLHPTGTASSAPYPYLINWTKLMTPRYKNWRKDLFTSAKPNSGFSSVSGISSVNPQFGTSFLWPSSISANIGYTSAGTSYTTGTFNSQLSSPNSWPSDPETYLERSGSVSRVNLVGSVNSDSSAVQVALYPQQIYNLMAQDKFLRSAVYADKNLSDQMKAIFGDSYDDCHCPSYLGSYSTSISISDVTATSAGNDGDTSDLSSSILGEIAGKGYNSSGKDTIFSRKFDYDGIVLGVHYIIPRNNYDSSRINLFNTKVSSFDYFYPQFDGLGMQPIYMFERSFTGSIPGISPATTLFGYGPRYHEYKQRTNEVHGSFQYNQSDSDWTLSNNSRNLASASNRHNYKVMPDITDRIFTMAWNSSLASDPFQCFFYYDSTLISDMEVYGTPSI